MAKYWARSGFSIDMSDMSLRDVVRGRGIIVNEHTLKISYGDGYATTLRGDFEINKKGDVTGGTIAKILFEDDDHYGTTLAGIDVSLKAFLSAAKSKTTADDLALFGAMLGGDDSLYGSISGDVIYGFGGNDEISGDFGSDILDGGDGDDWLYGDSGSDELTGGLGADAFVYKDDFDSREQGADRITDFSQADGDKIDLSQMGFFDFDTDIRASYQGGNTIVEVDTMGGFAYPLIFRMTGTITLTEADFIL